MEQAIISGVAHDTSEAKVTIVGVPDQPGVAARVFRALADEGVNVDMIVQNVGADGPPTSRSPCRRTTRSGRVSRARRRRDRRRGRPATTEIAKISLVGAGMKTHPGVAADMFDALAEAGDQHRDDLDLVDPDLVRRPRRATSSAPCRRCTSASSCTNRRSSPATASARAAGRARACPAARAPLRRSGAAWRLPWPGACRSSAASRAPSSPAGGSR